MVHGSGVGSFITLKMKCTFNAMGIFSQRVQQECELPAFGRHSRKPLREGMEFDQQNLWFLVTIRLEGRLLRQRRKGRGMKDETFL